MRSTHQAPSVHQHAHAPQPADRLDRLATPPPESTPTAPQLDTPPTPLPPMRAQSVMEQSTTGAGALQAPSPDAEAENAAGISSIRAAQSERNWRHLGKQLELLSAQRSLCVPAKAETISGATAATRRYSEECAYDLLRARLIGWKLTNRIIRRNRTQQQKASCSSQLSSSQLSNISTMRS